MTKLSNIHSYKHALISILFLFATFTMPISAQNSKDYITHEVKAKETVYSIARSHGLKEQDIYRLNPGSEKGIRIGETLKIPVQNAALPNTINQIPPAHAGTYTVVSGDTFYSIAKKFEIPTTILKQYNPDIDPEKIKPGMELRIALPDGTPLNAIDSKIYVVSENSLNKVKVALLLPIKEDGNPDRYMRFYQGFLMGMHKLKKRGVSIDLDLYTTPATKDVLQVISSGKLIGKDIVIGGQTKEDISALSSYTGERGIIYVSPFVSEIGNTSNSSASTFILNTPQEDLYPFLSHAFCSLAKGKKIYFINTKTKNHNTVVKEIKAALKKAAIPFEDLAIEKINNSVLRGDRLLLMPDDASPAVLGNLFGKLESEKIDAKKVALFGYPQWQSYDAQTVKKLGTYNTTIYTAFFFDQSQPETINFIKNYQAWFSKPIDKTYPKFSALGYDISRYFLRALASYGIGFTKSLPQVPRDGLQNDFLFRNLNGKKAFCSANLFFVKYTPSGKIVKQSVVF